MTTQEKIAAELARLAERTPEWILDMLQEAGITGCRAMADTCPVAQYMKTVCAPEPVSIWVYNREIAVDGVALPLPASLKEAVHAIDRNKAPALLKHALTPYESNP